MTRSLKSWIVRNDTNQRLLGFGTILAIGLVSIGTSACSEQKRFMTMDDWNMINDDCVVEGSETWSRLGEQGAWEVADRLTDKDCVKNKIDQGGFAQAVSFEPDRMREFKRELCDLYPKDDVIINGVELQRKWSPAYDDCME